MEYLFIYCLQLFESLLTIKIFCWVFGIIAFVVCVSGWLAIEVDMTERVYTENIQEMNKKIQKFLVKLPTVLLITALVLTFIPTKQTLLIMGGTWLGKKAVTTVVNDEKIQKIDTIINLELDKVIKDLKGNVQNANNNGQ